MSYGYYPGCSLHSTAREFDLSIRECCQGMGLDLVEVPDWNCCGGSAAHEASEELALALPARVLAQAERHGLNTVLAPCAACYNRLKLANIRVNRQEDLRQRVNELIQWSYDGGVSVKHPIEVLTDNRAELESSLVQPLKDLRVACYYGCLLARPPEVIEFDDSENPLAMDGIVDILGAEPVEWSHKTECCGAGYSISRPDIALRLVGDILEAAHIVGADIIAVACPLCHANLDMRQAMAGRRNGKDYGLPVVYISQLVGLAQGKDYRALGLDRHMVSPMKAFGRVSSPAAC